MDKPFRLDEATFRLAVAGLASADNTLATIVDLHGPPRFWARPPGFASLVWLILEQQVSLASARATYRRIEKELTEVTPATIATLGIDGLGLLGCSRQKASYIAGLAHTAARGEIDFEVLALLDDASVRGHLMALRGVGRWTADIYLLACLGRPDIWPSGDRALAVAVQEAMDLRTTPTVDELDRIGASWAPWRSVAARILWHTYLASRGRPGP